jgi:galactarate dehydratase
MTTLSPKILILSENDEVAVAVSDIEKGTTLTEYAITTRMAIPRGHKVALKGVAAGDVVRKYGQIIGCAAAEINPGEHIHDHNLTLEGVTSRMESSSKPTTTLEIEGLPEEFLGYSRTNGLTGTRNYIAVLSTVNCSATVCKRVAEHFQRSDKLGAYPNVDGVIAFTHGLGCANNPKGNGFDVLQRTLMGCVLNPNVGAVLVIGLGCETNQAHFLFERYGLAEADCMRFFNIQEAGGTKASINRAVDYINVMLPQVNDIQREEVPVSELRLALQCGGSDAYSGITANPALGYASDILVAMGGTAILSETPEIYGAEHLLMQRAVAPEVADKLMARISWWKDYASKNNAELDNNPSFGNKMGGLSTIYEKSLGAVAKGGQSPLNAVYEFAQPVTERGLVFVDTPGYDPICSTGQIASGANIMCFTTGRGSVSGFKPVPTLKLATNTQLYEHMLDDMDINCGGIVEGERIEKVGRSIFEQIVATASGSRTASERNDFGDHEFVPWQLDALL